MRVFKLKAVARFQRREAVSDEMLCRAVRDAEAGRINADLGGGLIKQRVARQGQGKSGGFRTLVAFRSGERAIFLLGFAKNERDNIDPDELAMVRQRARAFLGLTDKAIKARIAAGDMTEVSCDDDT